MQWTLKRFSELNIDELYAIVKLRLNVFVVEQNCPYPELDDKDQIAYHFFGKTKNNDIVAYTRIFGPNDYYELPAIGRVVVHKDFRRDGMGYSLMKGSIESIENLFGPKDIKIGAQKYLKEFYESLGFVKVGEGYIEDGIPHIYMIRSFK